MEQKARLARRAGRVFWAAFFDSICYLLILGIAASGIYMIVDRHRDHGAVFITVLLSYIVVRTIAFIVGSKVSCQLCHGPIFLHRRCQKHKEARKYPLLNHRATMVLDIVFRSRYCCMYCGTRYRLR